LPAGVPGLTENVRIRSVVGRFLEHSRVYYFRAGEHEELWLSSADWMNRNMLRRVELAWPIADPALRERIMEECLRLYLSDTRDAWLLRPDGCYEKAAATHAAGRSGRRKPVGLSAQSTLMARYGHKG
jgi:polyphosphate kinase